MPFRALSLLLLVVAAVSLASGSSKSSGETESSTIIGALLPLTGALASYGETSNAALTEAMSTINADRNEDEKIILAVEDTATDPARALDRLKALHDRGVRLVIGPYSSSEVKAVKAFADQNGIVLLSPLSTATTLAIPGDNVFRFTPDDEQEAKAVAAVALADGVRVIVPVTRDDEGNRGLQTSLKEAFEAGGGTVLPAITYAANETNFGSTVGALKSSLAGLTVPPANAAVYLTAFSEVVGFFSATTSASLPKVKWYGSDSVAQSKDLTEDQVAAAFAVSAGYPNPILGVSDSDRGLWEPVRGSVNKTIGRDPDAFALATYDAAMVGFRALTGIDKSGSVDELKQALVTAASGYRGLTGDTTLNPAGDRASGNYDFWSVCARAGGFVWVRTIAFTPSATTGHQVTHPEAC